MTRRRLDLLPGTLDMLVLETLTVGEMHGYAIVRHIQTRSADVLQVEEGSLYPALHRMHARGLIQAKWGVSESNRRAKFYALTAAGRKRLKREERAWQDISGAIAKVLHAKLEGAHP